MGLTEAAHVHRPSIADALRELRSQAAGLVPALALGAEPPDPDVMRRGPRSSGGRGRTR